MELVRESQATQTTNTELEARNHNAQIKERYRRLQSAEADQFAEDVYAESQKATEDIRASVIAPEAPVYVSHVTSDTPVAEQAPQVTEYVQTREVASVFTTEKFENIRDYGEQTAYAPVQPIAPVQAKPTVSAATAVEAQYSLTPLAKMVMAIFTLVVIAMISLICVNTHIIRQKSVRLQNLEEKREELVEQNAEIQRRIEEAQSYETIVEYAQSQGMVQAGN